MKLYRHLAWDGIRKNSRLYVPYLLTGVGAVSFFYILVALSRLPEGTLPGSGSVQVILNLGNFVLWVFSLLLLFYTHSFLIRRRNREFALYNVLGMGKGDISRILCWESLLSGGLSLLGGLALGVVLSKLAELGLMRVMGLEADMTYRVSAGGLLMALGLYGAIYLLILLSALLRVRRSTAIQRMRSEAVGEKPPRANWALALLGVPDGALAPAKRPGKYAPVVAAAVPVRRSPATHVAVAATLAIGIPVTVAGMTQPDYAPQEYGLVAVLAPDPDVPLDLGAAVRSVYTRGAYATRINYTQPPPPPVL